MEEKQQEKPAGYQPAIDVVSDDDLAPAVAATRRIRYIDDDDVEGQTTDPRLDSDFGHRLTRRGSSYSIHSFRSTEADRRVDPRLAFPVAYRTLSFNISNTQERAAAEASEVKEKTTQEFANLDWHLIDHVELFKRFDVSPDQGLDLTQVKANTATYGKNVHSPPPSHLLQRIFWYFFGGFGSILFGGCILVFLAWKPLGQPPQVANLALAIVLAAVVVIQALFNAWQDYSSSRVMKSVTGMLPEDCIVLRNGSKQSIGASEVVPGDILYLKAGNKLPADVRFIESSPDAKFDRSIMTGESAPIAAVANSTEQNYLETKCLGLQGTHCTSGSAIGLVVSTGDNTVFGHIAMLTSTPSTGRSNLQKEVLRFVIIIVSLMILMSLIVIAVWAGYIRHKYPDYMPPSLLIVNIVSVAIAFVPEGLPIAVTASLTIVANTMRKNNILCKSLKTVETLGSVSVLLSDKTGTLTKNQMVVTDCLLGYSTMDADEAKKEIEAGKDKRAALDQVKVVAAVCNAGESDPTTIHLPLSQRKIMGDATDQAVFRFSESLGSTIESRGLWKRRYDLSFNSKNKFALGVFSPAINIAPSKTLSSTEASSFELSKEQMILMIKGAPDVLISKCSKFVGEDGEVHEMNEGARAAFENIKDKWSREGKRCLLLARKILPTSDISIDPSNGDYEEEALRHAAYGLTLVALVGIVDPPRDEIPHVLQMLRRAGVRTMMVTGDFKLTAQAIARSCNIIRGDESAVHSIQDLPRHPVPEYHKSSSDLKEDQAIVISGVEIPTLTEHQWSRLTKYPSIVFARTTPDHKLLIVKQFQAAGYVTGMTGDGVNDSPSLKQADIGIAPGSGSDIAIEAADMVLLDSFAAILEAIKYGRTVFDNLKKTIAYLLPAGSYSEFWPVITSVIFGLPQVLSSFLMIIICCFTDCAAATVLAYEKPESNIMDRPPRNVKKEHLVDWRLLLQSYFVTGTIETVTSFAMSYWYLQRKGIPFSALWFSFGTVNTPANHDLDYITYHFQVASSIYFINLVVMQWFNLMAIRTRHLSIFSHPPIGKKATQNLYLFPAIVFALVVAIIFTYVKGLHVVAFSEIAPWENWLLPLAFGLALLALDEARKAALRRWPKGWVARFAW